MSKTIERRILTGNVVERKVEAGAGAAAITTLVLYLLARYVFHADVPDPIAGAIATVLVGAITFVTGYLSKHTARVNDGR